MKSIELSEVSALAPLLHGGGTEPLILKENGATIAAVVPANDEDVEDILLSVSARFQSILQKSQARLDAEGGVSSMDVRKRLGLRP